MSHLVSDTFLNNLAGTPQEASTPVAPSVMDVDTPNPATQAPRRMPGLNQSEAIPKVIDQIAVVFMETFERFIEVYA